MILVAVAIAAMSVLGVAGLIFMAVLLWVTRDRPTRQGVVLTRTTVESVELPQSDRLPYIK